MEHHIYNKQDLKKTTFLQKMLGQRIKENAIIELNNLLADHELNQITLEQVYAIADKYGVNFKNDYTQEITDFYKTYLNSCLSDKVISDKELDDLRELKRILQINDKQVEEIHRELAGKIYKAEVDKVIKDGELDEAERTFIEKLQNDLKLPSEVAQNIYLTSGQELIRSFMSNVISDAQLSPDEERELQAIAKNLHAEFKFDDATKSDLEKYRLYWQIENDEMPELQVDINIPRSEKCYFIAQDAQWFEQIAETPAKVNSNSALSLKIAKGLYWRNASQENKALDTSKWQSLDTGIAYLTNKRLLFKGTKGDKIVLLNRVIDFSVYSNGLEIEKGEGKNPFIQFAGNIDIFAMLLGKSISQLQI
jgi:hypothetical protein